MNCRRGDMAVIVESQLPENLGVFVEVVGAYDDGAWAIRPLCGLMRGLNRDGTISDPCNLLNARDSSLRPIRGLPTNQQKMTEAPCRQ